MEEDCVSGPDLPITLNALHRQEGALLLFLARWVDRSDGMVHQVLADGLALGPERKISLEQLRDVVAAQLSFSDHRPLLRDGSAYCVGLALTHRICRDKAVVLSPFTEAGTAVGECVLHH